MECDGHGIEPNVVDLQTSKIQSASMAGAPAAAVPANMDVTAVGGRRLLKGYTLTA